MSTENILDELKDSAEHSLRIGIPFPVENFENKIYSNNLIKWLNSTCDLKRPDLEDYDEQICKELVKRHEYWDYCDIPENGFQYLLDLIIEFYK